MLRWYDILKLCLEIVLRPLHQIGRGMRLSPSTGKTDCRIMDFVDVSTKLNVVSLPSLFGLDPAEIEDEGMAFILITFAPNDIRR